MLGTRAPARLLSGRNIEKCAGVDCVAPTARHFREAAMARRRASSGRARRSKAATIARRVRSTQSAYTLHASAGSSSRLKLRARQHAAIAALGERALAGLAPASLMDTAVRALAEVLEVELAQILELQQGGAML